MNDLKNLLNSAQYDAVSTDSQYTRVIAGAGSGKTRVLTYRIAYLIECMKVNPKEILAIAFTNKVANEMKERVVKQIPDVALFLHVSTFHSFGAKFLRKEIQHLGISNAFTIFDDDDSERLIRDICVEKGYSKKDDIIKQAINYIARKKCKGIYPKDVKISNIYNEEECLEIYNEYEQRKTSMITLDFDDLLLLPIIILENFPDVRTKWRKRIRHILIDEFQDTNDIQFKLLKLLTDNTTNVYVVGDPDQTIYTWRGANQKIILDFERTFLHAKTYILDQNYRSTKTILDAANKLIANNKKRVPKNLFTNNIHGDAIEAIKEPTKDLEATHVVSQINKLLNQKKVESLREIAILYRSAYLTLPFEKELIKYHIKYRIFGGVRFYQRKEIKDALAYFRLIVNTKDDLSFERIINVPKRKIGDISIEMIKKESKANNLSIYDYIKSIDKFETQLKLKVIIPLTSLINKIEITRDKILANQEIYSKILEDFLVDIGYYDYLTLEDDAEERIENLKTLFSDMFDYIKKNPDEGFQTWLENCTLATSQDDMKDDNYISLMTVHTAKGLEFNYVFVVGLADSVFPNQHAMDEEGRDGLEEERRLAYVAFTRAKKKLFLSMNCGYSFVIEGNPVESRFIKEAGINIKESPKFNQISPFRNYRYRKDENIYDETSSNFFGDFDISNVKSNPTAKAEAETNGVRSWSVGDHALHDVFGEGVVKEVIDQTAIIVDFKEVGKKTMLSTHKMLHKVEDMC